MSCLGSVGIIVLESRASQTPNRVMEPLQDMAGSFVTPSRISFNAALQAADCQTGQNLWFEDLSCCWICPASDLQTLRVSDSSPKCPILIVKAPTEHPATTL